MGASGGLYPSSLLNNRSKMQSGCNPRPHKHARLQFFILYPVTHSECLGGKGVGSENPEIECRAWSVPDCAGRGGMKVVGNGVEEKAIGKAARNYLLLFL